MEESSGERNVSRPSGAKLFVVKQFEEPAEFQLQYALMILSQPIALSAKPDLENLTFWMPLAGRVPFDKTHEIVDAYASLWRSAPKRACSREVYHAYARSRLHFIPDSEVLGAAVTKLFDVVKDIPVRTPVMVHGDATYSNAVYLDGQVRLIDFSPKLSPPEAELDVSKLLFSARGFDVDANIEGVALKDACDCYILQENLDARLLKYYLATHVARVMSREPPTTKARENFYATLIRYVASA